MNFLAMENFRLVDKGAYYSVGQVLTLDDEYVNSSRSLGAALRAKWARRINEKQAKEYQEKFLKSKEQSAAPLLKKEEQKEEKKDQPNLKVEELTPSAIADEVLDSKQIIDAIAKRKEKREAKETEFVKSKEKQLQNDKDATDKEKSDIKGAIAKQTNEKIKSRRIGRIKGKTRIKKKNKNK